MTDALQVREYGNARFLLHARDQALAAAGHDHVDIAIEAAQHQAHRLAVAGGDKLDCVFGQARVAQARDERGMDGARGTVGVGAAAQDGRIPGLETQRSGIGGHVRTAFVDDPDHAERHPHALDGHAVGPRPPLGNLADRIGQRPDCGEAVRYGVNAGLRQCEPGEEGGGRTVAAGLIEVLAVGEQDFRRGDTDGLGHGSQGVVFLVGRREREDARGRTRPHADPAHERDDVGVGFDRFQRCGHEISLGFTGFYHGRREPGRA